MRRAAALTIGLGLAGVHPAAGGGPVGARSTDIAWLPVDGAWAGIELTAEADRFALHAWLNQGYVVPDGTGRWWRVPAATVAALRGRPGVARVWGLPSPMPPPDDADLAPATPDFAAEATWADEIGVTGLSWWPGGDGAGVAVADVEYAWADDHEDLTNNPAVAIVGDPTGLYVHHGNACLGLVGAADDGFGTTGAAPAAELLVAYPTFDERYDVALAILQAADQLQPGDVLLIEQQLQTADGAGPVSLEPAAASAIGRAVSKGIIVVEPTGNGGIDLDDPAFEDWFSTEGRTGSLMVAGAEADGSLLADTTVGGRVDLWARGRDLIAPSDGTVTPVLFFPDEDPRQAYVGGFGGSSGASAQVAGLVAALQGIAVARFGEPLTPEQMRTWLVATGEVGANDGGIGVRPDGRRMVRGYLVP